MWILADGKTGRVTSVDAKTRTAVRGGDSLGGPALEAEVVISAIGTPPTATGLGLQAEI